MLTTCTVLLPIILVKSAVVQKTGTNTVGRDRYTRAFNWNNEAGTKVRTTDVMGLHLMEQLIYEQ